MSRNFGVGLVLFAIYCVLYLGFVLINTFSPTLMETQPVLGINLSISYGFALIVIAFVLAMIYGLTCQASNDATGQPIRSADQQKEVRS